MREIIVTVGTRASGKSTFCKKAVEADPSIIYISRDEILLELFGSTSLGSYSGGHTHAYDKIWETTKNHLIPKVVRIILDVWNENTEDRRWIIKRLRKHKVDQITAWYFTTPIRFVEEWFWLKPNIAKMSEIINLQGQGFTFYSKDAPRQDHRLFHQLAKDIDSDGFDEVIRINPVTMGPEHVLRLQTSLKS